MIRRANETTMRKTIKKRPDQLAMGSRSPLSSEATENMLLDFNSSVFRRRSRASPTGLTSFSNYNWKARMDYFSIFRSLSGWMSQAKAMGSNTPTMFLFSFDIIGGKNGRRSCGLMCFFFQLQYLRHVAEGLVIEKLMTYRFSLRLRQKSMFANIDIWC
jgi:hypothetical protein